MHQWLLLLSLSDCRLHHLSIGKILLECTKTSMLLHVGSEVYHKIHIYLYYDVSLLKLNHLMLKLFLSYSQLSKII